MNCQRVGCGNIAKIDMIVRVLNLEAHLCFECYRDLMETKIIKMDDIMWNTMRTGAQNLEDLT